MPKDDKPKLRTFLDSEGNEVDEGSPYAVRLKGDKGDPALAPAPSEPEPDADAKAMKSGG